MIEIEEQNNFPKSPTVYQEVEMSIDVSSFKKSNHQISSNANMNSSS